MKLNRFQLNKLVKLIMDQLVSAGFVDLKKESSIREVIENIILSDLKKEEEIEKEAESLIKKYSAGYHSEKLDYELLFKRAKHELAKKKGFKL